jgi:adenosylcobinamide-phosphate synthase
MDLVATSAFGATDSLFLLLAALAVEAYVGDIAGRLPGVPHPRASIVRLSHALERRLNRPQRSRRDLMLRGGVCAVGVVALAAAIGYVLSAAAREVPLLWLLEVVVIVAFLGQRTTGRRAAGVARALETRDTNRARQDLTALAGELLDPDEVARMDARAIGLSTVAGLGERFASAVVAPAFWYVLLGLPGFLAQQALRSFASSVAMGNRPGGGGYRRGPEGDFAFIAARLDAALDWIPDKVAGLVLALAALFIPTTYPLTAFKRLPRGHWWSIAALGGALRLAARRDASLSTAASPDANQVGRALGLFAVGCLIHGGLLAGLLVLRQVGGAL